MVNLRRSFDEDRGVNPKQLKETLEAYYYATGINLFMIDEQGKILETCGGMPTLCTHLTPASKEGCHCTQVHLFASKQAEKIGEGYVFHCPAGLIHYTAPVIYNRVLRGALIAGPILLDEPDDMILEGIMRKYDLQEQDRESVRKYIEDIPIVMPEKVKYLSKLLFLVTLSLMDQDRFVLYERNQRMHQQSHINLSLQDMKEEEKSHSHYPYEKEKELMTKVKNGDEVGAKTILNDILGHIFFTSGGNMEVMKARTLELTSLLSRAAVEGGGALDKIFGLNYKFIGQLSKIENIEDLSYWILKVLDRFMENVFSLAHSKNAELIKTVLSYINKNYMNNITLEEVSGIVYLNPSYFSTIFKKETGVPFSTYLNKVRIQESKQLLKDINLSILDIALAVGFEDQSYYSKVFKKITGTTPKEYRDHYQF
ncbi:PocR ligand-binding domain-containing protein [Geosporobacter ferrireducens]|uniref:PocR ligand-binding domain-containing protein n=1 Tax=Geosporobacter ferrireducens TaxID=1424294 RepID=UPI001472587C|nr:PocR ligand-binding domain-containing protein [Geosporobacter ferrireducens]